MNQDQPADRNSLGIDAATLERWRAQGLLGKRSLGPTLSPSLLALLDSLADLVKARAAGTGGPWFYNSYAAIFAAPLISAAEDWPLEGDDVAEPDRYYHEAEPMVAAVPPLRGDSAHGRHAADAEFIAAAGSFDFAGLLAELGAFLASTERSRRLDAVRVHEGDPAARLPFFDVATLLLTNDPTGLGPDEPDEPDEPDPRPPS